MRVGVVSTIFKKTPPDGYGGIERVVHILVEALVRAGHEVTLFATPGSHCSGTTVEVAGYDPATAPSGITSKADILSEELLYEAMTAHLKAHPVDIIHDWSFQNLYVLRHPEKFPYIISTCIPPAPDFIRQNLVACSRAHARLCGSTTKHVYYGLDLDSFQYSFRKEPHFIHISKIARYKGQHLAILAALRTGSRLSIAGNIEESLYFYTMIKPFVALFPKISYIGEIHGTNQHLLKATALVQTPRWFDAFPLVILEAFASGTPVIGLAEGGIPEQIVNGVNGFLCHNTGDIAAAMDNISQVKPETCRQYAEEHFTAARMAQDYVKLYQQVRDGETW